MILGAGVACRCGIRAIAACWLQDRQAASCTVTSVLLTAGHYNIYHPISELFSFPQKWEGVNLRVPMPLVQVVPLGWYPGEHVVPEQNPEVDKQPLPPVEALVQAAPGFCATETQLPPEH